MEQVYILDGIRTPIGRYAGGLSGIRADDLAALPNSVFEKSTSTFALE